MRMPTCYVVEMFVDRVSASKTYQKDAYEDWNPLEYYDRGAAKLGNMIHPETAALLRHLLKCLLKKEKMRPVRIYAEPYFAMKIR